MKVFLDVTGLAINAEHNAARSGIFRATEVTLEALDAHSSVDIEAALFGNVLQFQRLGLQPGGFQLLENLRLTKSHFQRRLPAYRRAGIFRSNRIYDLLIAANDWEQMVACAKVLNRERAILHSTNVTSMGDKFTSKKVTRFLNVYDLTPILYPEFFEGTPTVGWFQSMIKSIRSDDFVFCCSQSTKRDLLRELPRLDSNQVLVNYLATSPYFCPAEDRAETQRVLDEVGIGSRPFFLTTSTIEPRKNIPLLVDAFFSFTRQTRNREAGLLICGAPGWQYSKIMSELVDLVPKKHRGQLYFTNHVSDRILRELYRACTGFFYPSTYEGFGLPILEAMSCGAPIVASNSSSIPEVVSDAGWLYAPMDRDAFADAFAKLMGDTALRSQLSQQSLIQAQKFSLQHFARRTEAGYQLAH